MPLRRNSSIRHFLNYHNPGTMGYDFDDVADGPGDNVELSILTDKLVHDLAGDVVWMIGRHYNRSTYFLYGKFRVSKQGPANQAGFRYEVRGRGCFLAAPVAVGRRAWFRRLLEQNPNLSLGFQRIADKSIVDAMVEDFSRARRDQFGIVQWLADRGLPNPPP
jgi:hypothetical protein